MTYTSPFQLQLDANSQTPQNYMFRRLQLIEHRDWNSQYPAVTGSKLRTRHYMQPTQLPVLMHKNFCLVFFTTLPLLSEPPIDTALAAPT